MSCDSKAVVCWEAEHSLPGSVPEQENMQTHCCSVVVFCLNESVQTFSQRLKVLPQKSTVVSACVSCLRSRVMRQRKTNRSCAILSGFDDSCSLLLSENQSLFSTPEKKTHLCLSRKQMWSFLSDKSPAEHSTKSKTNSTRRADSNLKAFSRKETEIALIK